MSGYKLGYSSQKLQGSERYEAGEEAVENLEAAIDWLDDIKTSELEELLEDAKGW